MREILFRGKRADNGEWVIGYYVQKQYPLLAGVTYHNILIQEKDSCEYLMSTVSWYKVIPSTIGQSFELTDKNGKKIFEGDIVAGALSWLERRKNGIVTFRNGSFGLLWYRGEAEQFNPFTSMCNVEYEVIGNIHDNPELLKGGVEE